MGRKQTSIMGVAFAGGVVIGADSRTTTGSYIANRVSDKLTKLASSIYCCRSGSAADTQAVAEYVRFHLAMHKEEIGDEPSVATAARVVGSMVYNNKDALMAGIIIAGYDPVDGGSVHIVPLGGGVVKMPFAIGGSGSTYIYGWVDDNYREGMTRDECVEFVKNGLALAMARDGSSGGLIRMAIIDADGVERTMIPGDQLPKFFDK